MELCNIDAEKAVLSAITLDNNLLWDLKLNADDFCREGHKVLFKTMQALGSERSPIDALTLTEHLQRSNLLEVVGGAGTLLDIVNTTFTTANANAYADIIKGLSLRRVLMRKAEEIKQQAEQGDDINEVLQASQGSLLELSAENVADDVVSVADLCKDTITRLKEQALKPYTGIATGFGDLDKMTGGFKSGELVILAARPAMGKTAFVLNLASNISLRGNGSVLFFSLEMSAEQLRNRLISSMSLVEGSKISRPITITQEEWKALKWATEKLSEAKLYISDTPGLSPMQLRSIALRQKHQKGLDLIIVDYLQLMQGDGKSRDNRVQEVSEISRKLKLIARELNVPIIALSQLSRAVESRQSKKPILSDLRESGSIEQDADVIAFLYRDEYYNPETNYKNIAELIIAKQRNGPLGTVNLFFKAGTTTFRGFSRE